VCDHVPKGCAKSSKSASRTSEVPVLPFRWIDRRRRCSIVAEGKVGGELKSKNKHVGGSGVGQPRGERE
jgi:hypothetical protein